MVVQVGGTYWADVMPDLFDPGYSIPSSNLGTVGVVDATSPTIDPLRGNTSASTHTFNLIDVGGIVSAWYGANNNFLFGQITQIWVGAIGQAQSFPSAYQLLATMTVNEPSFSAGVWQFQGVDVVQQAIIPMYNQQLQIPNAMTSSQTSVTGTYVVGFPNTGYLKIDGEIVGYTSVSGNLVTGLTFSGLTRGLFGSTASSHDAAVIAYPMDAITANPIMLALGFLVSTGVPGTNGIYDTFADGGGIPAQYVDVSTFLAVAANFSSVLFTVYPSNETSVLDAIQQYVLTPLNVRIVTRNGLISCVWVDNFNPAAVVMVVDETMIEKTPTGSIDATQLVTTVIYNWDWLPGSNTYQKNTPFTSSQASKYGPRAPFTINVNAQIQTIVNGVAGAAPANFFTTYADQFLLRFGNPVNTVTVSASRAASIAQPGDIVLMNHRYFPQPGGGLGHSAWMMVLDNDIAPASGKVTLDLQYPSFSGYKVGAIAPSPYLAVPGIDPRNLSGLMVFVDPDTVAQADGTAVASITDSAQGIVFSQSSGPNQPILKLGVANGHNVLRLAAASAQSMEATITRANVYSADAFTMVAVVKQTGNQGSGNIENQVMYDLGSRVGLYGLWDAGSFIYDYMLDCNPSDRLVASGGNIYGSAFHVLWADRDGSRNERILVDGSLVGKAVGTADLSLTGTSTMALGTDTAGAYLDGDVACYMLFNRKLTAAEMTGVNAWIQNRYFSTAEAYSQQTFPVAPGDGAFFQPGFAVVLWRGSGYTSDPVNTVQSVNGDVVTVTTPWTTKLDSQTRLKFADYQYCNSLQQALYAFVGINTMNLYATDATETQQLVQGFDNTDTQQQIQAFNLAAQNSDGTAAFQITP